MGVFYPYAIEEPEDEPYSSITREVPRLPDHFEKWQRDLVDDVNELENKSTPKSGANAPMGCTRGQKRKSSSPESPPDDHTFYTQTKPKCRLNDTGLSPKRRRQYSRIPSLHTAPTHKFHKADQHGTLSPGPRSADWSSPDSVNEAAVADEMDID